MQLISNVGDRVPYGICNAVIRLNANQWRALVQQYGPVFALQQARLFGGSAAVAFLIDLLTPGIINRQGYGRLAFCLKHATGLVHTIRKRSRATKQTEVMQPDVRALTFVQFNTDGRDDFQEIARHERRDAITMIRVLYRWKLSVISRKYHKVIVERNLGDDVQKSIFHHPYFIKAQRAFEVPLLHTMLEPAQSDPCIELRSCHVGARANERRGPAQGLA